MHSYKEDMACLLKVLSLSHNKSVADKGHKASVILKSHLLVIDGTSVLLSTPEGYANKRCLFDSQLNNKCLLTLSESTQDPRTPGESYSRG